MQPAIGHVHQSLHSARPWAASGNSGATNVADRSLGWTRRSRLQAHQVGPQDCYRAAFLSRRQFRFDRSANGEPMRVPSGAVAVQALPGAAQERQCAELSWCYLAVCSRCRVQARRAPPASPPRQVGQHSFRSSPGSSSLCPTRPGTSFLHVRPLIPTTPNRLVKAELRDHFGQIERGIADIRQIYGNDTCIL